MKLPWRRKHLHTWAVRHLSLGHGVYIRQQQCATCGAVQGQGLAFDDCAAQVLFHLADHYPGALVGALARRLRKS